MGMTNEQFNSYQKMLLRRLEHAEQAIKADDNEKKLLLEIIKDLREDLAK